MEATKEVMKKNLQGFSGATLLKLWEVVEFVENYIGTEATKQRIKENLAAFFQSQTTRIKKSSRVCGKLYRN